MDNTHSDDHAPSATQLIDSVLDHANVSPQHRMSPVDRRQCLRYITAAAIGTISSVGAIKALASTPESAWSSSFSQLNNGQNQTTLSTAQLTIEGKLPLHLQGTFYRNGPARFTLGGSHLTHWFDGDGMVQAIQIQNGKASHYGQLLRTPKLVAENAAGRHLYAGFGSRPKNTLPVRNADQVNCANINVMALSQTKELFALWEAGSALSLDPVTLAVTGFKEWSPQTAGAPFGAHPRIAQNGSIWNFGYITGAGKVLIYHIAPSGKLLRQTVLELPQANMVHDFAITENYLVFLLQPLHFDAELTVGKSLLTGYSWMNQKPLIAAVVSKQDWSTRFFDLPNGGVYHINNAFEYGGKILLGYSRYDDILRVTQRLNYLANSEDAHETGDTSSPWTVVELNLSNQLAQQIETEWRRTEFPRIDPRRTGLFNELTILLERSADMHPLVHGFNTVTTLRTPKSPNASIQSQRYQYGHDWIAEEHIYVVNPTQSDELSGWIIGSAYQWKTEKTSIFVFEANALGQGPVAILGLPYALPMGLHGQFVPS